MGLEVIEGFDYLDVVGDLNGGPQDGGKPWSGDILTSGDGSLVTGRDGSGQALRFAATATNRVLNFNFESPALDAGGTGDNKSNRIVYIGFAVRFNFGPLDLSGDTRAFRILRVLRSSTEEHAVYVSSIMNGVAITNGGKEGIRFATGAYTFKDSQWHYIQYWYRMSNPTHTTDGAGQLWVDGRQVCQFSGKRTWDSFVDHDNIQLTGEVGTTGTIDYDDIFIGTHRIQMKQSDANNEAIDGCNAADGMGPQHTSLPLEDPHIVYSVPTGDGTTVAWTRTGGSTHYTEVDEDGATTAPDDDTTYIESNTSGQVDLFDYAALGAAFIGRIDAVGQTAYAKDVDGLAAGPNISARVRSSSVEDSYSGTTLARGDTAGRDVEDSATYQYHQQVFLRPVTSAPANQALTVANAGAETAIPSADWVIISGGSIWDNTEAITARTGSGIFNCTAAASVNNSVNTLEQRIDLTVDLSATQLGLVDDGAATAEVTAFWQETGSADAARVGLRFYDEHGDLMGFGTSHDTDLTNQATWTSETFTHKIPSKCREVGLCLIGVADGTTCNVYFDDVSALVSFEAEEGWTEANLDAAESGWRLA